MLNLSIFVLLTVWVIFVVGDGPIVKIKQGELQGGEGKTQNGRTYYYFTGVPFARPPVGWYRYEAPVTAKPWSGTLDATRPHNVCLQFNAKGARETVIGDEDCLYLNIYTPQISEDEKKRLPVMFYIDGDDFDYGNPNKAKYGPELLLDKDVILVTVGYRLGALGFFLTEDSTISGNLGLKDQAFALKWVKQNIIHFGGNPEKITVFGNEAGAACAHYHMLSPLSRDLISGVIAQSGTAFNSWALAPIQVVGIRCKVMAGVVGCPTRASYEELVKCLKTVEGRDIINATKAITESGHYQIFKPLIELGKDPKFLPKDPINIVRDGEAAKVPVMIGLTTESGAIDAAKALNDEETLNRWAQKFEEVASHELQYGESAIVKDRSTIGKAIKEFYFGDSEIGEHSRKAFTNMFTDGLYLEGMRSSFDLHLKYYEKPIFKYLFGYRGTESYTSTLNYTKNYGVAHKDELLYLFKNDLDFPNYTPSEADKETSKLMVSLWTNFATYGDPTPPEDSTIPVKWESMKKDKLNYYYIQSGTKVELKKDMFAKRTELWRSLPLDSRRMKIRDEL